MAWIKLRKMVVHAAWPMAFGAIVLMCISMVMHSKAISFSAGVAATLGAIALIVKGLDKDEFAEDRSMVVFLAAVLIAISSLCYAFATWG